MSLRKGDALALAGALFWSFHVIILGKYASRFEALSFSVGQLAVCGLISLVIGLFCEPVMGINGSLLLAIAYTAIFSIATVLYPADLGPEIHTSRRCGPDPEPGIRVCRAGRLAAARRADSPVIQLLGCGLIFAAVLLSQFKEWTLLGTIDRDHLIEGR